jgi:hypothetical protein
LDRIIWTLLNGEIPEDYDIDHIDQNGLNNKIENLRCVPKSINSRNTKLRSDNKTGLVGIHLAKPTLNSQGYQANIITINGTRKSKYFSFKKYGKRGSFKLAQEWYNSQNLLSEGYTKDHGKKK